MSDGLLLDTNVVLYLLKGNKEWKGAFQRWSQETAYVSVITVMELFIGRKSESDRATIERFLEQTEIILLTLPIATRAFTLLSAHSRSLRSPHLADAIIAATATELGIPLLTNNPKDFRRFRGVTLAHR